MLDQADDFLLNTSQADEMVNTGKNHWNVIKKQGQLLSIVKEKNC